MSWIRIATCVLSISCIASPVWAGAWSLGTNLGAGVVHAGATSGTNAVLALPSNALTYQPAFRIGFGNDLHTHDAFVDAGALVIDEAGSTLSLIVGSLNYQYVFTRSLAAPFANVGVGFMREGGAVRATTRPTYSGGLGVRRMTRDGHGALRAEARVDHLKGDGSYGRPDLTTIGVRLGFDLWL